MTPLEAPTESLDLLQAIGSCLHGAGEPAEKIPRRFWILFSAASRQAEAPGLSELLSIFLGKPRGYGSLMRTLGRDHNVTTT